MKKKSKVVVDKKTYEVKRIMGNIALIEMEDGEQALLNVETNEVVLKIDRAIVNFLDESNLIYLERDNILKVYDVEQEKLIIDGWKIEDKYELTYVLKSPVDGKLHLFNPCDYLVNKEMFKQGFDDVRSLEVQFLDVQIFSVCKNGNFGLYLPGAGFIASSINYDEIDSVYFYGLNFSLLYALTKNGKKQFIDTANGKTIDYLYDDICVEGEIVAGIERDNDGEYYDFYRYDAELGKYKLLAERMCDDFECISFGEANGCIIFECKSKKGLIRYSDIKPILEIGAVYDKIEYTSDNGHFLKAYKNGKCRMFGVNNKFYYCNCNDIQQLGYNFYLVLENGIGDIVQLTDDGLDSILLGITSLKPLDDKNDGQFKYIKDGSQGIVSIDSTEIKVSDTYDDVRYLGLKNAIVTYGITSGLMQNGKIILSRDYDEIYSSGVTNEDEILYFAYRKSEGEKYSLARTFTHGVGFMKVGDFDSIDFYRDIMVLGNSNCVHVCDYHNNCLASFVGGTVINEVVTDYDEVSYLVNGEKWIYRDGKFEKMPVIESELYMTAYECKYGTVVVNSDDKEEHDRACASIEDISTKEVEATLRSFYQRTPALQQKYPKLVKKR